MIHISAINMLNLMSRSQLHSTKMSENMIFHIKMQDRI